MYESDIQEEVSSAIIQGEVSKLNVGITDNERAIIVNIGTKDAAYTADEARDLANSLKSVSDQRWDEDNNAIVEYIRDLADILDGDKAAGLIEEKWEDKTIDGTIKNE
jgi:hypothetical protein